MHKKIFCIGFHKTGTSSLAAALKALNYRVHGPGWVRDVELCANLERLKQAAYAVIEQYDAFQDNPWPLLWQELAADYPDALFILTLRDDQQWLDSACRYFADKQTPMRALIYGVDAASPLGNEERYLQRYRQHNQEVQQYFAGRSNFLLLDVSHPQAHDQLLGFLGLPLTGQAFPHLNKNP